MEVSKAVIKVLSALKIYACVSFWLTSKYIFLGIFYER